MRKIIHVFLFSTICIWSLQAQEQVQLTTKQKLDDFDSLYYHYKEVYPYFGVNKRQHNIDWLKKYDTYRVQIEATKNDKEYLSELINIIGELNCGHASLRPTKYYNYYFTRYRMVSFVFWSYGKYVRELKKNGAKAKSEYWTSLYKELYPKRKSSNSVGRAKKKENVRFETFPEERIAVMKIRSFEYDHIKKDKKALLGFYQKIKGYDKLIIDLQGNGGGDTRYWQKNIVPYLSDKKLNHPSYMAFRNTDEFYRFAGKLDGFSAEKLSLKNMPEELISGDYLITKSDYSIKPRRKSIRFKGEIIVLADHGVYSSAEAFVNFCASSGFAKVAGEATGGDGVGADPFIYTLPISGIVTCHPGIMGLNADGSSNEEMGTFPDIPVKGDNVTERYDNLLKMLTNKI